MSLLKYVELTGESPTSWAEAGRALVKAASRTLRNIRHIEVTRLTVRVETSGELTFQTTAKLAFAVENEDDTEGRAIEAVEQLLAEEGISTDVLDGGAETPKVIQPETGAEG